MATETVLPLGQRLCATQQSSLMGGVARQLGEKPLLRLPRGGYKEHLRDVGFGLAAERWQFCFDLDQSRDAHLGRKSWSTDVLG